MRHQLRRQGTSTYRGGSYYYYHYTLNADGEWIFQGDVYGHTPEEAIAVIKARAAAVIEWDDDEPSA